MPSKTIVWAPPGTDPEVFAVRVGLRERLTPLNVVDRLGTAMAERAETEGLSPRNLVMACGAAIGETRAQELAWVLEDRKPSGLTPREALERAAEVVIEHSNLPDLLEGMEGFPTKELVA